MSLRITSTTYRGVDGFNITGKDTRGRRTKVFAKRRETAEHIRDRIKDGHDVRLEDWSADEGY